MLQTRLPPLCGESGHRVPGLLCPDDLRSGGNLYYYQEKLYYTILGGIQTDAVLAQANPTGTETKTLVKIQDTLTDTISAYQSSHSGAVVTGITPQILGAHNGKLYIKATVSYSISQNGTSSFQDQSVFLFYDCADGSTGQLENEEIQAQLDSGIPVYAVLSGNRMICLFTQKDQDAETLTATRENTYQLISVNLDSQKVEKTLDFDDVGIMELHLTQSGDFYLTEDVTDSENHTRTYYEYGTELEQKDEYTLDLNQFNSPWRLDNDLICTNGVLLENGEYDPQSSQMTVIDLETQESKTHIAPYSLGILGTANGKVLACREMTRYFLLDGKSMSESPAAVSPTPVEGLIPDPYLSIE